MAAKPMSTTASDSSGSLRAGIVVAIVLSVLTLLSVLGYFLWRVFRRRTRLVRPYKGKVDLIEKYTPGHRKNPSQSSERPLLHEPTSRSHSPDSLRSNVSAWLQGQHPDQQSYSYHGVGSNDHLTEETTSTRPSYLITQDLSSYPPRRPTRPAPPLETIYSAIDTEPPPDRLGFASRPKRPAPPLETLYGERWDAESVDFHIPRRPAPFYSTTSLVSSIDRDSESSYAAARINSTLDKFPAPPQSIPSRFAESSSIGGILRKVGDRLSRSFSPSHQETESVQDSRPGFRPKFHQQSASLDTGRREEVLPSSSASKTPRSVRGRLIPPPPTLPPPSVPPSVPLPSLPSNHSIPFDGDSTVNTHAVRPLRMERGPSLAHHKSASVY